MCVAEIVRLAESLVSYDGRKSEINGTVSGFVEEVSWAFVSLRTTREEVLWISSQLFSFCWGLKLKRGAVPFVVINRMLLAACAIVRVEDWYLAYHHKFDYINQCPYDHEAKKGKEKHRHQAVQVLGQKFRESDITIPARIQSMPCFSRRAWICGSNGVAVKEVSMMNDDVDVREERQDSQWENIKPSDEAKIWHPTDESVEVGDGTGHCEWFQEVTRADYVRTERHKRMETGEGHCEDAEVRRVRWQGVEGESPNPSHFGKVRISSPRRLSSSRNKCTCALKST